MTLTVGSMCTGYGGLEMALRLAGLDTETAWLAEIDPHASKVAERHHPDAPNLGDLTQITDPPAVDIVTAGFPCQPNSAAGNQEGIHDERWIIEDVCRAARSAEAKWLVLENVYGLLTANGGDALSHVCAAMAEAGFSRWEWTTLRASDVGACHRRERWFCVATSGDAKGSGWDATQPQGPSEHRQSEGATRGPDSRPLKLLPTPTANQPGGSAEAHLERKRGGKMNRTNPTVTDLGMVVELLPTPNAVDGRRAWTTYDNPCLPEAVTASYWGKYSAAVERWANLLDRTAPAPTEDGRLNPVFVEWMMGLPLGHVTATPGLSRAQQLKILGNGVMPQQAAAALQTLAN